MVLDQPYTAEDGFLPDSPPAIRRKEDATNIKYAKMHSDKIWESAEEYDAAEEEKQQLKRETILVEMMEPDLDEMGYRGRVLEKEWSEGKVGYYNKFGEDGSGYKDFSDPEEAEVRFGETEIPEKPMINMNQKGPEVLHHWTKFGQMLPSHTEPQLDASESERLLVRSFSRPLFKDPLTRFLPTRFLFWKTPFLLFGFISVSFKRFLLEISLQNFGVYMRYLLGSHGAIIFLRPHKLLC